MNNITYEINNTSDNNSENINENIISNIFQKDNVNYIRNAASAINVLSSQKKNELLSNQRNEFNNILDNNNVIIDDEKNNLNGWDDEANITIKNWHSIFKQNSFIYQLILDKNLLISDRLHVASIISSSFLGLFTGFKLWKENDIIFQTTSNIILMLSNFSIAIMTGISKRYIDDKRNETIKQYIFNIDIFLGEISAQLLKTSQYRMNADEFFKINNDKYTSLITSAPNLSILEMEYGKIKYNEYKKYIV